MDLVTLHIEHRISDLATWRAAFDRFADTRRQAGVRAEAIRQPIDDPDYLVIDLGFDTTDAAARFLEFLERTVWSSPDKSPALAGRPVTRILCSVSLTAQDPEPAR